jgi:hypothetical protein
MKLKIETRKEINEALLQKRYIKKQTEIIEKRDEIFLVEKQYTFIKNLHAISIFKTQ